MDEWANCDARRARDRVVEVLPLLCSVADRLRQWAGHAALVEVSVAPACPPCQADRERVERTLQAIAVWALAGRPQSIRLGARGTIGEAGEDVVELTVTHHGASPPDLWMMPVSGLESRAAVDLQVTSTANTRVTWRLPGAQ